MNKINNISNNNSVELSSMNHKNYLQKLNEYKMKINNLSNELSICSLDKKRLENKINLLKNNLIEKDNTINNLNKKIIETKGKFNLKFLEIQKLSDENKKQMNHYICTIY